MAGDAAYSFRGIDILTQQISTATAMLPIEAEVRTEELAERGKELLQSIQMRSKQEHGVIVGGPAAISWDMYNSIDYESKFNSRGRTQYEWGFLKDPPDHVRFKELGTRTGMIPMRGLNQANQMLNVEFDRVFDNSMWRDIGLW